jgi:tetratricopeptide (TPR) repeat protein
MPQRKNVKTRTPAPPSHQHVQAGFTRLRANRLAEAAQAFQRALCLAQGTKELDGEDFTRLEHLIGQCLRELRNIGGARLHLERALAHAEAFYGAGHEALMPIYTDLADVLLSLGAPADAKALCERALKIESIASASARTLCSLGKAHEHLGNRKEAEAHYRKALALAETQPGLTAMSRCSRPLTSAISCSCGGTETKAKPTCNARWRLAVSPFARSVPKRPPRCGILRQRSKGVQSSHAPFISPLIVPTHMQS